MPSESRSQISRFLPILNWLGRYDRATFSADALASLVTAILLIPQSLAYAMLAGLPAEAGLYASIAPLMAYAMFGSSRVLAVGPVAVVSLMTAAAIGNLGLEDPSEQLAAAAALALLSGAFLVGFGLLKLGGIANFLSRPVISAFVTASSILIIFSQLGHVLGIRTEGATLPEQTLSLVQSLSDLNIAATGIGIASLFLLVAVRYGLPVAANRFQWSGAGLDRLQRGMPAIVVALAIILAWSLNLESTQDLPVVGALPASLPPFALPLAPLPIWRELIGPAALISLIGFVESVSVGQSLAARRRENVQPDRELIGLGAANAAAALTGGYPVTGGLARSVVNESAGAQTPLAGVFTALIILFVAALLTPAFYHLPKATLAATILVAIVKLTDFRGPWQAWKYSRADGAAAALTLFGVLFLGVEIGLTLGVVVSIGLVLQRTMEPHWAEVGQVPGTHHFRNINRHEVITSPHVISLRVDAALYFANAQFLEHLLAEETASRPEVKDIVLVCPAVNFIDASALASLRTINTRLQDAGVKLHLSEVKGPVNDQLQDCGFYEELTGIVFLSQYAAMRTLDPDTTLGAETAAE
jgi:SulP family sulfate permease